MVARWSLPQVWREVTWSWQSSPCNKEKLSLMSLQEIPYPMKDRHIYTLVSDVSAVDFLKLSDASTAIAESEPGQ